MTASATRLWHPQWPCPVAELMRQHRRGHGDPTWLRTERGWVRGVQTPDGAGTLFVEPLHAEGAVRFTAWGVGRTWLLDQGPRLLGAEDSAPQRWAPHPVVDRALRARPHWRSGRTDLLIQDAVVTVLEQKVTGQEALGSYRTLVRQFGQSAPGPAAARGVMVPPTLTEWRNLPSHVWLGHSVDHARAGAVTHVLNASAAWERAVLAAPDGQSAERLITTLPGIGRWTAAELRQRSLGDSDAVSYGDYHVAGDVGWAVRGVEFSDAELEEFLEPWAGHRGRVVTLVRALFGERPRRGPRMEPRRHMPGERRWR